MNCLQCYIYDSSAHQRDPQKNKSHPDTFIHHLPAEILEIIFKFVLRPLAVPSHYGTLQSIASVCKQWQTVVYDSGRLWALVTSRGHTPPIATILAKSKSYPLSTADYIIGVRQGDDLLFANLHRWRHVPIQLSRFNEGSYHDLQQQLWTKPAILLESARIYAAPSAHSIYQPSLFGGCAPRLRTLCFINCSLGRSSFATWGLQQSTRSWTLNLGTSSTRRRNDRIGFERSSRGRSSERQ